MFLFIILFCSNLILILLLFYNSAWFGSNYQNDNNLVWSSSYECGFVGETSLVDSFSTSFFILLVFFVVFDLEISLLLNVGFQENGFKNLIYYLIFIYFLVLGYLFEVFSGFIKWEGD
nr:NADH dehydrogenase subunit 3 [Rhabdosynochus viridisi]